MRAETPSDECIECPRDDASATAAVAYNPLLISFRWIIAVNMFEATARLDGAVGMSEGASCVHAYMRSRKVSGGWTDGHPSFERSPSGWRIFLSGLHLTFSTGAIFLDERIESFSKARGESSVFV